MSVRSREVRRSTFPDFCLSGSAFSECSEVTYLGHVIVNDLSDDKDIYRQRRKLYAQANMLCCKFSMCSVDVKISLFSAYCTSLYTAHLWCHYKQGSLQKLMVAYNDSMRLLLRAPRSCSASNMCVSVGTPTCSAVLRNFMVKSMCRASESENYVIKVLANTQVC